MKGKKYGKNLISSLANSRISLEEFLSKLKKLELVVIFLLLFVLLILNFIKAIPYELLTFDSLHYLKMAESFWNFKFDYVLPYITPLVNLFLVPKIKIVRVEMIFLYIILCFLFYLFVKEKLKIRGAILSLILFSFCWWNVLSTLEITAEYFSLFFLFLGFLVNNNFLRSIFLSFSFLLRPDSIVFILPFLLFLEKDKGVIPLFITFSFLIDIFLFAIFYKTFNISFLNFFLQRIVKEILSESYFNNFLWIKFLQTFPQYVLFLLGVLYMKTGKNERRFFLSSLFLVSLLGFLPFRSERIFFQKIILLLSISGAFLLQKIRTSNFLVLLPISLLNILIIVLIQYPSWLLEIKCCSAYSLEICFNLVTSLFYESFHS